MNRLLHTIALLLTLSLLTIATAACHSSRKTVRGSSGTVTRTVDYSKMRSEVNARHYDIPQIGAIIAEAARWLGVPYKYAGNDRNGVDCSGLTSQVFRRSVNVAMPRSSREQQQWCIDIKKSDLQPGDLVFFATGSNRSRVSHVGIYIGGGDMIHASSSRGVIVSNLDEKYYASRYHSSGRPGAVHELYAKASKKSKKSKGKEKGRQPSATTVPPAASPSAAAQPSATPAITLDEFIGMQVDSIAAGNLIDQQVDSIANTLGNPAEIPTPVPPSAIPTAPAIHHAEPADTIFNQFFD